jgi:hypothetical protein
MIMSVMSSDERRWRSIARVLRVLLGLAAPISLVILTGVSFFG